MIDVKKGDCLELMKEIPDKSIDMILCDLPYGKTANKWDKIINSDLLWKQYKRIIKDHGCIVLFGIEPFSSLLRTSNLKMYRYDWVWFKNKGSNFFNAKKMPLRAKENISVFYKHLPTYNPQMREGKPYFRPVNKTTSKNYGNYINTANKSNGKRYPLDYLKFAPIERTIHPTQKPVKLLEYLIRTYTNENDVVLDNCLGSGSTAIAAINTNRNFIGYELDNYYYNVAKDRINNHLKEGAKVD